ncbi:hypothetical protein CEXT_354311 [Caerostris extrusa]|uniref:Secreted protein n=1 Tax=Caerostris extrusa TaxID=172846 RepID=A0AAV4X9Y4_CAEEX|nr:hypothetical protein CEXT_354311 [Caerostris extrusa]
MQPVEWKGSKWMRYVCSVKLGVLPCLTTLLQQQTALVNGCGNSGDESERVRSEHHVINFVPGICKISDFCVTAHFRFLNWFSLYEYDMSK